MFKILTLILLLLMAQQGAVVHELSHVSNAHHDLRAQSDDSADRNCALCPAFAQVVTPAFSHSFAIPVLVRLAAQLDTQLEIAAIDAAVPHPRSRGPPSLS